MRCSLYNKKYGSSLIEISVVLVLLSYAFYLAISYLQDLKASQKIQNLTSRLESLLIYSRNQAILTNKNITVCSTLDGKTCYTGNSKQSKEWQLNWMVYEDIYNSDISKDADKVLYLSFNKVKFIQIDYNRGATITFNNMGRCIQAGTFTINYNDGTSIQSYTITVSTAGRIRQSQQINID
jgi:Tfp pilus assembly protein FimT